MKKYDVYLNSTRSGRVQHTLQAESEDKARAKVNKAYNGACVILSVREVQQ